MHPHPKSCVCEGNGIRIGSNGWGGLLMDILTYYFYFAALLEMS